MSIQDFDFQQVIDLIIPYGFNVVFALLIYIVGKQIVQWLSKALRRTLSARDIDPTISNFVCSIAHYLMLAFVFIAALSKLGVQTASVVAIFGAAGLAIGLALQGTLSNFAAGVMLILLRPLKVGDFVQVAGESGKVSEVAIFATTLLTGDNKTIIIANAAVMGDNIINFSTQSERRVDLLIGVGYSSNLELVKNELKSIADAEDRILKEKEVTIGVVELADSSVNFVFRSWVKSEDYWATYFALNENVKVRFDEVGIEIPFPQLDIHKKST